MSFRLKGMDALSRNVLGVVRRTRGAKERALRMMAEPRLTKMKQRTPVDEGNLRASEFVDGPRHRLGEVEVAWVAGGPSTDYAIVQHEDTSLQHTVGQAKFIESVVMEDSDDMLAEVAEDLGLTLGMR